MTQSDITNSKSGDMPQILKWMYIMELKHNGFVVEMSMESSYDNCDLGERLISKFVVHASCHKLDIFLDEERGVLGGALTVNREQISQPVYEIGKTGPVAYIPMYNPITSFGGKF